MFFLYFICFFLSTLVCVVCHGDRVRLLYIIVRCFPASFSAPTPYRFLVRSPPGPRQVPVRTDEDLLPRGPSRLPGEAALRPAASLRSHHPEASSRLARQAALREAAPDGAARTGVRARLSRQKVGRRVLPPSGWRRQLRTMSPKFDAETVWIFHNHYLASY